MIKQWAVHWVTAVPKVPAGSHPFLADWGDLAEVEGSYGIDPGDPFMTDPHYRVDARLTRFFGRSSFVHLAKATKKSYTNDYRVFFDFLWGRGKNWDEVSRDDLLDFEDWRRRSARNLARIGGAKWNRRLAAFRRLYEWAAAQGHCASSPVALKPVRTRDGDTVQVPEAAARDVRSSNVKWLTPRAFRQWRDVGVCGYTADGRRDTSWRGRNDDRNAAFADLLYSSGLRRTEGGSLLTVELPSLASAGHRYLDAQLGGAVAKGKRPRTFYVSAEALRAIEAYCATTRRAAIRRAQAEGRYVAMDECWVVHKQTGRQHTVLHWRDLRGRAGQAKVGSLDPEERELLFTQGPAGLEPLWLWLSEAGMPFGAHSWEAVFRAASQRTATVLAGTAADPPFCTPHMARHSFALHMLVALHHAMDQRFGLTAGERRDFRLLYGDPWRMVKDLLGHASEETTRNIYLAPVSDLQIRSLLTEDDDPGVTELLSRIARASERVLDSEEIA